MFKRLHPHDAGERQAEGKDVDAVGGMDAQLASAENAEGVVFSGVILAERPFAKIE